ncbi:MAG: sigma-70 family RNA polymerase sigma factor [Actinomycetota bacterium]|nr:sigma-70 family RNA polymerase sigma factor [Actinomycetota bacterium]
MDRSQPFKEWPDRDLVVAFKAGDADAYNEMYRRYGGRVEGVCRRMLGNADDAHEAAQETFLKAYQALPRFNGNYQLGAWVARIAANVCLDQLRAQSRRASLVSLPEHKETLDLEPGPEDLVATSDRALDMLGSLQPLYAKALAMRGVEGMSHKEIAAKLSMTPMQVKALLHRARDSFKRAWEDASGWMFAPFAGFRSMFTGEKHVHAAGAPVTAMSTVGSPLLAEKMAASAMMVAAAIAGVSVAPSTASPQPAVPNTESAARNQVAAVSDAVPAVHRVTAPKERAEKDAVAALLTEIKEKVESDHDTDGNDNHGRRRGDDGEIDPTKPTRASRQAVREVKDTLDDLMP